MEKRILIIGELAFIGSNLAQVLTYLISKLASAKVKVVLSGNGGDELFAGCERFHGRLRKC